MAFLLRIYCKTDRGSFAHNEVVADFDALEDKDEIWDGMDLPDWAKDLKKAEAEEIVQEITFTLKRV